GSLKPPLPPRPEAAAADRMLWIAFELLSHCHRDHALLTVANGFDIGVHDAHRHAAPGAAQRADARLPLPNPRHHIVFRDEADDLVLGTAAARERRARARDRRQLDEGAPAHVSVVASRQSRVEGRQSTTLDPLPSLSANPLCTVM